MFPLLLLLFIAYPVLELWLLFRLSGAFGFWTTMAVVLGTGMAGAALARWQGLQAIVKLQEQMRQGMLPAQAIGDGVLILVAGLLLITPGLISDISGILLLIPPVRKLVLSGLRLWLTRSARIQARSFRTGPGNSTIASSTIIDAKIIDARSVDVQGDEP